MVCCRPQFQEESTPIHRGEDITTRRVGSPCWVYMQQQQQYRPYLADGRKVMRALWDFDWPLRWPALPRLSQSFGVDRQECGKRLTRARFWISSQIPPSNRLDG